MWKPHGVLWFPHGHHVVSMLIQNGYNVDTRWFSCEQHHFYPLQIRSRAMKTRSRLYLLLDYPPHDRYQFLTDFHHFQINSVAIRSRKITNLWKPITFLIMIQFSIYKRFWKALDLLYQLVVFLCHFPLRDPWGKWPGHFPFGQISLQSHVTTLNQQIRSLDSLKSPSSRWNLWDFVRFHSKFFPHLKNKAVRTALLKIRYRSKMATKGSLHPNKNF